MVIFLLTITYHSIAQITINNYAALSNAQVANALVDSLMGSGITFSNASFQGVRSSSTSYGYQTCYFTTATTTQTQMGISRGVALTSGNTNIISIPQSQDPSSSNSFSKGYVSSTPGELRKSTSPINDLTILAGPVNWFNAAILEFDFVPSGDSVIFRYVFGGEEYSDNTNFTNYQCTQYNDKFGFLISGPGINGTAGYDNSARNIARLSNGSEVGINSVNNGTVGGSAVPNGASYCQGTNPAWTLNTPTNEYYGTIAGTSPNGNTKNLAAAQGGLTPGATYHIKLLILDAADGAYDAIVYIEAGSFTSPQPGISISANPQTICAGGSTYIVVHQTNGTAPYTYTWSNSVIHNSSAVSDSILVSPTSNATYSVTVTDAQSNTSSASINITVNQNPTPVAGSNSPICQGANLNLTVNAGTIWHWSGPNSYNSTVQNPTITAATPAASGTYTVTVTNASGCTDTSSVNVTVNSNPTPVASSNSPICQGANLNLTVTSGTSWHWTGPNSYNSTVQNPTITAATPAASGTYTVTVTNSNGCTGTSSVNVTVNSNPTPVASSNSPVCEGNNLNLTVTTGSSWHWSGPNSYNSTTQNPTISAVTPAASGTYTVTVTNASGCTGTSAVNVTVNSSPTPTAGSNSPICQGSTLNLTVTTGTSWSWTGPNSFSSTTQNPIINAATQAASGTYSVTVTNASGCTAVSTVIVNVNTYITVIASSNSPICQGANLNLTANTGTIWSWSGPNSFTSTSQNPVVSNVTPSVSGTYTVNVTNAQGCSGTATTVVIVNSNPTPAAGSNSSICEGGNLNLTTNTGNSWLWTGPVNFNSSVQNPTINNTPIAAGGSYTVTVTDANGCTGTATTVVTINPAPVINAQSNPSGVCYGSLATLSATGGASYQWSSGETDSTFIVTPQTSTTYTVTGMNQFGCTNTTQVLLTVYPTLVVNITPAQSSICQGETAQITASSTGNNPAYSWDNGSQFALITVSPTITTTYNVIATDTHGCNGSASTVVTVNPIPTVDFEGIPLSGCMPLKVNFTSLSDPLNSHVWSFGDNISSTIVNPEHIYTTSGSYTVTLTVISGAGCTNAKSKSNYIEVYPKPYASFSTSSNITDGFESVISFTDHSTGATTWLWNFGDADSTTTDQNPSYTYTQDGSYAVWLYVENQYGCTDSTSRDILIRPLTTLYVPNAFTPNGDGINDYFGPKGIGIDLDDFEMYIYDRWGKLIFMTKDINILWDGKVMGSDLYAGEDVYSWVIFLNKQKNSDQHLYRKIGNVTMLR